MHSLVLIILKYRYLAVFGLAAIEGPLVACAAGVLITQGYFNFPLVLLAVVLGDVVPDSIYYFIGRYGKKKNLVARLEKRFTISPHRFRAIEELWHTSGFKAMLITKFGNFLTIPFFITSGLAHLPVRKFYLYSTSITIVKTALFILAGMYFASVFTNASPILKWFGIIAGAVALIAAFYYTSRSMKKQFRDAENTVK